MKSRMVWRCCHKDRDGIVCGETFVYYRTAERHADAHGGARIDIVREMRP